MGKTVSLCIESYRKNEEADALREGPSDLTNFYNFQFKFTARYGPAHINGFYYTILVFRQNLIL